MIYILNFRIWAIHFYTPVKIRAYYGIPLFVRPSTPRTVSLVPPFTDRSRRDMHCINKRRSKWSRGVILVSLENASFHMVYTINWFKKCSILITVLTLSNCHKRGEGRIMAQLFILSYSDAVSFRDIRGHLGTIPSIVTFNICACHRRRLYQGHPSESRGIKIGPTCRRKRQKNMFSC